MTSRADCRKALADLLDAALVDGLGLVREVYPHKVDNPNGRSPLVGVLSLGALRPPATFEGNKPHFFLGVQTLVLAETADGYTMGDAEDALDAVEAAVAEVIEANRVTAMWLALKQVDRSRVVDVRDVGGRPYFIETFLYQCLAHWGEAG